MRSEIMLDFVDKHFQSWELIAETKEWYIVRDKFGAEHSKKKCFTKDWRKYECERIRKKKINGSC